MSITQESLYKSIVEAQQKFYYFTLTIEGAAIAYTFKQVDGRNFSYSIIPLFIAIGCWCISFYKGLKRVESAMQQEHLMFERGEIEKGNHFMVGKDPIRIKESLQVVKEVLDKKKVDVSSNSTWHFRLLIYGVIFFVFWNLLEMAVRSNFI